MSVIKQQQQHDDVDRKIYRDVTNQLMTTSLPRFENLEDKTKYLKEETLRFLKPPVCNYTACRHDGVKEWVKEWGKEWVKLTFEIPKCSSWLGLHQFSAEEQINTHRIIPSWSIWRDSRFEQSDVTFWRHERWKQLWRWTTNNNSEVCGGGMVSVTCDFLCDVTFHM